MKHVLKFLEKFYLSVINDKKLLQSCLQEEALESLSIDIQEKILDITVENLISKKFPPPVSYKKFFLRTLIDSVENSGCELSDRLIESYTRILSLSQKDNCNCYCTYLIKETCTVTLQESPCFVTNSTTGLKTWEASKYLLEWCLENAVLLKNKTILELGCGIGLLGISIVKLCQPRKYLFSDKSLHVLNVLTKNIEINFDDNIAEDTTEKHQLHWDSLSADDAKQLAPDIIIGADLTYDPSNFEPLARTLKLFLLYGKANCAFISSAIRNSDTVKYFTDHLNAAGLIYEVLDFQTKSRFIYNESSTFALYKIFLKST